MAMATAMGDCRGMAAATAKESATATEMATAIAVAMATVWATITRKGCLFMWQRCAALLEGGHLASTPMNTKKVHSPALRHGGDTAKSVCFPSKGRVPDSSQWIMIIIIFTTTVQFTEQPSVCPPHYSGAQEPCQPIDALPPPLLQEPRQPIDDQPRLQLHFFVKVSLGRACNDYNLNFCVDMK
jgi:hypothetical protein